MATPAAWAGQGAVQGGAAATPQDLAQWWRQLGDAQLTGLVERALQSHTSMRSARAAVEQARASVKTAQETVKTVQQAQKNAQRSTGSMKSAGNDSRNVDPFLAGFDS